MENKQNDPKQVKNDHFEVLYNSQRIFQNRMEKENPDNAAFRIGSPEYNRMMSIALIGEVYEALNETKWKEWKKTSKYDQDAFKDELVDCQIFLMDLMFSAELDVKEFYERMYSKIDVNHDRQNQGY